MEQKTKLLSYLILAIGSFAVVIGGIIPFYDLTQAGKISCSSALGFGMVIGGVILLGATFFIDKGNFKFKLKMLYLLCALVIAYFIQGVVVSIIPSFYGLRGISEKCTLFLG